MLRRKSKRVASDPDRYADSLGNPAAHMKQLEKNAQRQAIKSKDVGYARPPVHSQFKPGRSGNPLGRPKGSKSLRSAVEKIFTDKITVREGSKVRRVTRLEAVLLTNLNNALRGDQKAIRAVYVASMALGLMDERPQKFELGDLSSFTSDELEEFRRLLKKASGRVVTR